MDTDITFTCYIVYDLYTLSITPQQMSLVRPLLADVVVLYKLSMSSSLKVAENNIICAIPPVISTNPREKIVPEKVPVYDVIKHQGSKVEYSDRDGVNKTIIYKSNLSISRCPLSIEWSPSVMFFEINDSPILQKLRIWNVCSRSIYIVCCGLWGSTGRLGAKWRCFPRTRYLLAPGLTANLFIQATSRETSPVPSAQIAIQLAAAHKRDQVVGYFAIPIMVKFKKYIKPCLGEAEISSNEDSTNKNK